MVKSTLREIRTSLARYLAIFAIVALGVGFFSGLKDTRASMVKTTSEYLDGKNFYDYQILSSYGIDDESVRIASEWEGVAEAEGSVQIDVMARSGGGDAQALKAISLPESINKLNLASGRLPEKVGECVMDAYSITDEGYTIGDTVVLTDDNDEEKLDQFRVKEFRIVGTVNTPIYLDYQRGSTDIGNGSLKTFFFIEKDAFNVDYMTTLYVKLRGDAPSLSEERDALLDDREDSMKKLAEAVTEARRETARAAAQEELDEKTKEYEENLRKYEEEKVNTETKLLDAKIDISSGETQIDSSRMQVESAITEAKTTISALDTALAELYPKRQAAEEALNKLKAQRAVIEEKYREAEEAGLPTEYLENDIESANSLIQTAEAGLADIDDLISQAEMARAQAQAGLAEAEEGRKELKKQSKKVSKSKSQLEKEAKKAESSFEKAKRQLEDAKEKLDDAQRKIDDMETGTSYAFSRTQNAGYVSFESNSSIVSNIAKVFPVFFFLIAALVCMTTMTRMIDEQRTQIGVLMALGYSNSSILAKYMFYSGSAAFLGAVVGFFVGCRVFPKAIWSAYTMMYDFTDEVDYVIDPKLGLASLAVALLCSMGATWISVAADFKAAPAELIRPKAPPAGKRILLERIGPLWRRISFLYKVSFRNIFRDKKRFLMMVIGISGCTALLVAGMGIRTTISKVADYQYDEISLYDFHVIFSKDMNEERQAEFLADMDKAGVGAENVKFMHQGEVTLLPDDKNSMDITCVATDKDDFSRFVDLHGRNGSIAFPGPGEVVIVRKLQHDYGYDVGDTIKLRDGYHEMELRVSGVADNYVYDTIYMSNETYERGMGRKGDIKAAYVKLDDGAGEDKIRQAATIAANYENTAAVQVNIDVRENIAKMMKSLDMIVYVVKLSAAILAFIVLYNLTNISITERTREIATIKVLGFRRHEVSQYVFRENLFMTAVAVIVGLPLGRWLLKFVIDNIILSLIYFEPRLTNMDMVIAVVLTFVFAFVVNLVMQKRLSDVSMTESLKSVE